MAHRVLWWIICPSALPKRCKKPTEPENMLSVEMRFLMQGKEVSVDSFVEGIVRQVRASVREEISETFLKHEKQHRDSLGRVDSDMPRKAVSVREAARLLSFSVRTVDKYVALKVIRTVRVGRHPIRTLKGG